MDNIIILRLVKHTPIQHLADLDLKKAKNKKKTKRDKICIIFIDNCPV